ncbi:DUF3307 domain-containing protein [Olivibacter sp. SDN3]|nr:DUF3307 domain-containing protein [Olivibacter sp. SDN3]
MVIFLKLLLAHLIGDFLLQTGRAVKSKEQKKIRSFYLYIHCIIHTALTMLIVWNIHFWPYALCIGCSHFIIDITKLYLQKEKGKVAIFLIDQACHLLVLFIVAFSYARSEVDFAFLLSDKYLLLYTCILLLTSPSSIFIKIAISNWSPQNLEENQKNGSLQNAGRWIGNLERLLIFVFIVVGRFEAIGFLLAAKSIFRFGDLKQGEDRRLTEYVLIGTLLSFGIAILTGLFYINIL